MTTRMTDERLAEITMDMEDLGPGYAAKHLHWLLALCLRQREALRAVADKPHSLVCPVVGMAETPSNVETHCTCYVAKVRAALEGEP